MYYIFLQDEKLSMYAMLYQAVLLQTLNGVRDSVRDSQYGAQL